MKRVHLNVAEVSWQQMTLELSLLITGIMNQELYSMSGPNTHPDLLLLPLPGWVCVCGGGREREGGRKGGEASFSLSHAY